MKRSHSSYFPGFKASTFVVSNGILARLELLVISARPLEWIKNTILFAALLFSKNFLELDLLVRTLMAIGVFCLASSGVYLMNDIWDRNEDKHHPKKSLRPIASGTLPIAMAAPAAFLISFAALTGSFVMHWSFGLITTSYLLLNILYSKWLKHLVILDVFSIATGFVLRVIAGAVVIDVVVSHWLLICTGLLALFLGFSKRRYELVALANDASLHRRVLGEYSPLFLDMMIGIVTSATLMAYSLYTVSSETIQRFHTDWLLLTIPFVLYGIFRYLYLVYHKNHGGNPSNSLLTDTPLLISIILWGIASGLIVYSANS
jgi:4-hydroxybenzoate polyprenyltransferase